MHAIVMVLVHDMSSECAIQMYEFSLKYGHEIALQMMKGK